jgi:hypothetical protein
VTRRCTTLAVRTCAICLLILAVSPLTAPFSTLDVATLAGQTSSHEGTTLKNKVAVDAVSAVGSTSFVLTSSDRGACGFVAPPNLADRRQIELCILRI